MSTEDPPAPYRIGRRLGRGAVASVHEVVDGQGQRFAGKFLHASRDGDEHAAARFRQEAELLAGLEHPHLVRVDGEAWGVDEQGERRAFVRMELVEGAGLDVLLAREAPLPPAQVIELGRQLAEGLAYAHTQGIVHRDLKPSNVLVSEAEGQPPVLKIADFGMARASSLAGLDASALTILGTPDYMAPESLEPLAVDARADLYALGCMLFEMLTGAVPYPAATPFGVLRRHREDPIPELPERPELPAELRALVHALLAKSPADRPPSAKLVAERLAELGAQTQAPVTALAPLASLSSRCAGCGEALVDYVAVCLNCGLASITLEPGRFAVLITGPGEIGDKLDSVLRESLLAWLEANARLGLRPNKQLTKQIPRMPFVFATEVSERCAEAICASLGALGIRGETHAGGRLRHAGLRQKIWKLSGRVMAIAFGATAGLWQHTFFWAAMPVLLLGGLGATAYTAARAALSPAQDGPAPLGPQLRAAFDQVELLAGELALPRHRHALRAVVRQSLELREQLGPARSEPELAAAVERASTTTAALAHIDGQLQARDLNQSHDDTRALLRQRDQLAARLAELGGTLESLRIRARRLAHGADDPAALDDQLDRLQAHVEALEELERDL